MTALEQQWAELYARGVVPREVACVFDYQYGTATGDRVLSEEVRRLVRGLGMRIESHVEYQARVDVRTPHFQRHDCERRPRGTVAA